MKRNKSPYSLPLHYSKYVLEIVYKCTTSFKHKQSLWFMYIYLMLLKGLYAKLQVTLHAKMTMPDLQLYTESQIWFKIVEDVVVVLIWKSFYFCSPFLVIIKRNGKFVNVALLSLHGGSLEITLGVHLKINYYV